METRDEFPLQKSRSGYRCFSRNNVSHFHPKKGFVFSWKQQWKHGIVIKHESRAYFRSLGSQIAMTRKARGMTQAELARAIGVSQQAVFAYELGERRVSVLILAKIAKVFTVPVEEMIGLSKPSRIPKGRLSPRAMRHAERLQGLTKTQQRFVIRIIDVLESSNSR
ncbi:helix-turn-helix transcriptional regulator [Steroidobacter flavus]|uniref:Helix-turn-helix transcriptional regulator n=1 Tax=Steroidobacter flavus TaxID=1842136 RepID=A0ABV8SV81_9GAMM